MSKAADELYISKQNMALAINSLEAELGVTIFQRTSKGMLLTKDGEKIIDYANQIMTIYNKMQNLSEKNILSLNISTHISNFFLSKVVTEFNYDYPNCKLSIYNEMHLDNIFKNLHYGKLDLAIMNLYTGNTLEVNNTSIINDLKFDLLLEDEILFLACKSCGIKKVSELAIKQLPLLSYDGDQKTLNNLLISKLNCSTLSVANVETYSALIEAGLGVGLVSKLLLENSNLRYSDNVCILENDTLEEKPIIKIFLVIHEKDKHNSEISFFSRSIKENIKTIFQDKLTKKQ